MNRAGHDRDLAAFNAGGYDGACDVYAAPMSMAFFGVAIRGRDDL